MSKGLTYRNWRGRPALTKDGAARVVMTVGGGWIGAKAEDGIDALTIAREGASIGEGHFADMFAAWRLPDLDGWYQSRADRPFSSLAAARAWARR